MFEFLFVVHLPTPHRNILSPFWRLLLNFSKAGWLRHRLENGCIYKIMKVGLSATKERLTLLLYLLGNFWCVNSVSGRNVNFLDRVAEVKKFAFAVVVVT